MLCERAGCWCFSSRFPVPIALYSRRYCCLPICHVHVLHTIRYDTTRQRKTSRHKEMPCNNLFIPRILLLQSGPDRGTPQKLNSPAFLGTHHPSPLPLPLPRLCGGTPTKRAHSAASITQSALPRNPWYFRVGVWRATVLIGFLPHISYGFYSSLLLFLFIWCLRVFLLGCNYVYDFVYLRDYWSINIARVRLIAWFMQSSLSSCSARCIACLIR